MEPGNRSKHRGLSNISRKSDDVAKCYDNWASDYDETIAEWRYEAPEQVASMLMAELSPKSVILDAGCGTGLSGRALRSAGFTTVDGIDISLRSLKIAGMSGAYSTLRAMDIQRFPLPIPDDQYDGLVCVGVFTYLTDSAGTLREFSRIVRSGGIVVFTQRSDLFAKRKFQSVLKRLSDEGWIEHVRISERRPYLPYNEEYGDEILVHYVAYTVV
ncbi:MAG: class I SAM-dependent methyltransferase [Desulfobacterales bacterium]|nr:MAG: class I SAM-dependent methyltransferase [Desulfobacterales bacterium]